MSSPGDVAEERDAARALIKDDLPVEPFIRNKATFDVISWDDPHAPVAMPAHLTPQEAVNQGLPKPSECDIVIVILWGRMGTLLAPEYRKENGEPYFSGTEWEYEDAIASARQGGKPIVLVYRRTEPPDVKLDDPEIDTKREQYRKVQGFFKRFTNPDGSFRGSLHSYASPEDFRDKLYKHLKGIIQRLLEPGNHLAKAATAPALQSRIQAFLDEYLKSETGPVPFGGRDRELGCLDAWLTDDEQPSRFLLTAPAGRGKSALLVRWLERLENNGTVGAESRQLVFVPISIRFNTNEQRVFYRALAERLAMIVEQQLEQPATDAAGFYADKVREFLTELSGSARRVLIVLDGVDEALRGEFDSTIVPRVLSPNVRIVISARWQLGDTDSTGWQQRLDWRWDVKCRTRDLDKLDRTAIGDVLVKMGAPLNVVAADQALVDRLVELTEGEPLLLRFYAADLWQIGADVARITREDLDSLRPGFGPYFDRWLENQQKAWRHAGESVDQKTVEAVLAVLAFAFRPLEGGDVLRLVPSVSGSAPPLSPQALLEPLRRFVIGDGSADHGYVLSHPKIGEYLQQERFRHAASTIATAFVSWGRDVLARLNGAAMKPANAPRYLLQFYSRHLQDFAEATPQDYLALVNDGWRRALEHFEGGQQGFAHDVHLAWAVARKDDPLADLGAQFRCALTLSSIRSLGHNVPAELIVACVQEKVMSINQAVHLTGFMRYSGEGVRTLLLLASTVDPKMKDELLNIALARANGMPHAFQRAQALAGLADHVPGEQRDEVLKDALTAALAIDDKGTRVSTLCRLADRLSREQRDKVVKDALAAAKVIANESFRARALRALARHLSGEQLGDALAAAKAIGDERSRALALSTLVGHLSGKQREEAVRDTLAATRAIGSGNDSCSAQALSAMAGQLSAEQQREVLAVAKAIGDEYQRATALTAFLTHLFGEQRREVLKDALAAAMAITHNNNRAEALIKLLSHLPKEQLEEVVGALLKTGDTGGEKYYRQVLPTVLAYLPGERREKVLKDALAAALAIKGEFHRAWILATLAHYVSGEQREEVLQESLRAAALGAAMVLGDGSDRVNTLRALAPYLSPDQLRDALAAAMAIGDVVIRVEILSALAGHLPDHQREEVMKDALAAAVTIRDGSHRARALSKLAGYLPADQIEDALAAARLLHDELHRSRAMSALASQLSGEERDRVLKEAVAAVKDISDEYWRARSLSELVGRLSGELREEAVKDALAMMVAISDESFRAAALGELTVHLSSDQRERVSAAVAVAKSIANERFRAEALAPLVTHLCGKEREEVLRDALTAAKRISNEGLRAKILSSLAVHLPDEEREEVETDAIAAARAISEPSSRARTLGEVANNLSGKKREEVSKEALAAARAIGNEDSRAGVLSRLAVHLAPKQREEALIQLLEIAAQLTRPDLLRAIPGFAPIIAEVGGTDALLATCRAIRDTADWYP